MTGTVDVTNYRSEHSAPVIKYCSKELGFVRKTLVFVVSCHASLPTVTCLHGCMLHTSRGLVQLLKNYHRVNNMENKVLDKIGIENYSIYILDDGWS